MKDADRYVEPEPMDAEDMLYLLYTSGSTGKPKGIVHTTGGYLTGVSRHAPLDLRHPRGRRLLVHGRHRLGHRPLVRRLRPARQRRDHAHVRGHAGLSGQGPLLARSSRSTASRSSTRRPRRSARSCAGATSIPNRCDLSSLRLLGTVGEPINPEAWVWYWKTIGGGQCPVVDTWWQTETGPILITPLPGVTVCKPGSATLPFPGIEAEVVNDKGEPAQAGYLVIKKPWPSMLRGIYGDPERYVKQYWSQQPGVYFTGDGAKRDKDGYLWLLGRIDDVMNISGHRVSTMEVESALVDHPAVAEAAVIGRSHEIKGQAIAAFVTIKSGVESEGHAEGRDQGARRQEDRRARAPRRRDLRRGAAEDAQRQDHAPAPARRRRGPRPRRHHHAGRPGRGRRPQAEVRG